MTETTIIFVGDPHIKTDNIKEFDKFTQRLYDLVTEKKPGLICIGGDILHNHERLHTTPLNKAYEFIDKMRKLALTFVLVGNHDLINNQQHLTTNHWMNGMKEWDNVVIVDKVITHSVNNKMFTFVPYVPNGRFIEALETSEDDWKQSECIFAHQEFRGCKMGAMISEDGDHWPLEYPDVVSGHIHSRQRPQNNVYYSGSAMQHAFGESDKNIIPILTFDGIGENGNMYSLEEIDLELPRKKIVYMDIQKLSEYTPPKTEDKIKITLAGTRQEFKALKKTKKYKSIVKSGIKVVYKAPKLEKKKELEGIVGEATNFSNILLDLVKSKQNPIVYKMYQSVVNNKEV